MKELYAVILLAVLVTYLLCNNVDLSQARSDNSARRLPPDVVGTANPSPSSAPSDYGSIRNRWGTSSNDQIDSAMTLNNSGPSRANKTPTPGIVWTQIQWDRPFGQTSPSVSATNPASSSASQTPAPPGSIGARWRNGPDVQINLVSPTPTPGDGSIQTRWKNGLK